MSRRNIYLPVELDEAVATYDLKLSELCQKAIREEVARIEKEMPANKKVLTKSKQRTGKPGGLIKPSKRAAKVG